MESGAYGASLAGGAFDFASFIKLPQTIVRILSWIFSVVVFATITGEGFINEPTRGETKCIFNQNDSACSYGVGIGVLAFLACVVFLVADAIFPQISNAKERKFIVLADLSFSGAWTFLWFVCFCLLANQWSKTVVSVANPAGAAGAIVAFSFFSTISWGILTLCAVRRYRQGVNDFGMDYTDPSNDQTSPYPPYPHPSAESPFAQTVDDHGDGRYQPPLY